MSEGLFSHVKDAQNVLVNPMTFPAELSKLGWVTVGDPQFSITLNFDALGRLLSTSNISRREAKLIASEVTRSVAQRDRLALTWITAYLQGTNSIGGKGRNQLVNLTSSATKKIMETVQMSRKHRVWFGGKGQKQEEGVEEGYNTIPQGEE